MNNMLVFIDHSARAKLQQLSAGFELYIIDILVKGDHVPVETEIKVFDSIKFTINKIIFRIFHKHSFIFELTYWQNSVYM